MSLGTYCGIGAHNRCALRGCQCDCHTKRGATMVQRGPASSGTRLGPAPTPAVPPPSGPARSGGDAGGIIWEEPPLYKRRSSLLLQLEPLIERLRRRPGCWARLRDYEGKSSAVTQRRRCEALFPDVEFRSAAHGTGSAIWARYTEPEAAD